MLCLLLEQSAINWLQYFSAVYEQMCNPKWVVAFGVCTCTGGFYDDYATVQGIDTIVPVDLYIPGCPPRPETVLDGLIKLQNKIQKEKQAIVLARD